MITLYGLKSCDTCRKARRKLADAGIETRFVDLRDTPVDRATLTDWLGRLGPALVNTRSTTWRGLSEAEREAAPVDLLDLHPALIKRPVIVADGALHLGWTPQIEAALGL